MWTFQERRDVETLGADAAPWHCGWYEPDGRRRKKTFGVGESGKRRAENHRAKIEGQLREGTYQLAVAKMWPDFRKEYEERIMPGLSTSSHPAIRASLKHFERLAKPRRVFAITTATVDAFIAKRRADRRRGELSPVVSPATVNKDLRHLKAVFNVAVDWGYLAKLPRFRFEREPDKLPTFLPPEHLTLLYGVCDQARHPANLSVSAGDWWRGLLVTIYMTGWRIGQTLALKREDVDLDAGTAISGFADNKGKRDVLIDLHPLVVEHLRRLVTFTHAHFFEWHNNEKLLFDTFGELQVIAGVRPARKVRYGFHDLRRAFATLNADKMTPDALQRLMQHQCYTTTQKYIDMTRQLKPAVEKLFVPDLGQRQGDSSRAM